MTIEENGVLASWAWLLGATAVAALLTYAGLRVVYVLARRGAWFPSGFKLMRQLAPPLCLLLATFTARLVAMRVGLLDSDQATYLSVLAIGIGGWTAIVIVNGVRHWLNGLFDTSHSDNLRERRVQTQLGFIEKIVDLGIFLSAVAAMLFQSSWGRTLGTSLLASAGVASVIIGFAAQRTIANLIAGFQIAFTQPVRIGDAVVIENEWGWVEEISLTYVVVRIWDLRRLVLPITYLIEKPFQNWTRTSGQILGSVHLHVSHHAPFKAIEKRFNELLEASDRWDRDARVLQVVDSTERSVMLRALMTSKDSPTCWDLRCEVRRGLLEFLAAEHPEALPVVRIEGVDSHGFSDEALKSPA